MGYKGIRRRMAQVYKNVCMMEASGIRYIPKNKRIRIKGYKKSQEQLTYHHLVKKENGGKVTEDNGAILKRYNHEWLHSLPSDKQELVNEKLRQYKLAVVELGYEETQRRIMCHKLDFTIPDLCNEEIDYIVIQAYQNHKKERLEKRQYAEEAISDLGWRY